MARDVEKVHKWELVKVEAMFPFWIQVGNACFYSSMDFEHFVSPG